MEKKNFTAASVLVAMLIASGHFIPATVREGAGTGQQMTETDPCLANTPEQAGMTAAMGGAI